ncbi:MAG: phosphotriesterase-related protein [Actinomycetia bacterium]|nr:phosphotriesterase-related protein [Actinomycetes bacterium]
MARVRTVLGEIDAADLGPTLFHEHLIINGSAAWRTPQLSDHEGWEVARKPVEIGFLGRLRNDPYLSLDNTRLDDVDLAVEEASRFKDAAGATIVEVTPPGAGRNPTVLAQIAERTGLNIVMGCGFYLERTHPASFEQMSVDDVADTIAHDVLEGVDGVCAGVIGEIGVGLRFTPAEERSLRGAARAAARTAVPLVVHLPGWLRYGHRVLDVVEEEGADPNATVLAHMNPSHTDREYQHSLADRGAWLEYDMLGMELGYPGEGQSPSDAENAAAVTRLIADGYGRRLLLSHDIFIKTLLKHYGGFGYAHVLTGFAQRLEALGVSREVLLGILTDNPRSVFEQAVGRS